MASMTDLFLLKKSRVRDKMNLKIALLQILPGKDLDENLLIGKKACEEAKEKGADVICTLLTGQQ